MTIAVLLSIDVIIVTGSALCPVTSNYYEHFEAIYNLVKSNKTKSFFF